MKYNISYSLVLGLLFISVTYAIKCSNLECLFNNNADQIVEVNLRNKYLQEIPNKIFELKNLEVLNLSRNQITIIPEKIGNLKNLQVLDLGRNQITAIPKEICNLTNLTELYLDSNKITSIPEEIGNLINLTYLELDGNQIATFPKEICILRKNIWMTLYMDGQLEKMFCIPTIKCTDLECINSHDKYDIAEVDLSSKNLTTIPNIIFELKILEILKLHDNQITSFSKEIFNLRKLEYLDLHNNRIITIPKEIGNLENLTYLNLDNNCQISPEIKISNSEVGNLTIQQDNPTCISSIPNEIGNLENLKTLSLSNNQIITLPEVIGGLVNLTELNFNKNCILIVKPVMGISYSKITGTPYKTLKGINEYDQCITTIPKNFRNLINLTTLSLVGNQIKSVPSEVCNLKNLKLKNLKLDTQLC